MNSRGQKHNGYQYARETLYTAIVVCKCRMPGGGKWQTWFLKYRNVDADKYGVMMRFRGFLKRDHPEAKYINLYGAVTADFIRREYL